MSTPLDAETTESSTGTTKTITIFIGEDGWKGENPRMLIDDKGLHMDLCKGADGNEYKYDNAEYTNGKFTMTVKYDKKKNIIVTLTPVAR
ncbi:Hypothetical predicted protein [Mytilus galloprovincialis]|uniref:Uncharacterized protein n=1 Tax=Mytilus galloprovincialis TaxID=29158 RepID=A0A8B6BP72_MYTGA|nr:Hypothetical predicted protein [Mytilus galloprovincialis]